MLSAIEDKVRRRFNEQMAQNEAELDILQQSQRELSLGKNKLDSILTSLNKEKVKIKKKCFQPILSSKYLILDGTRTKYSSTT